MHEKENILKVEYLSLKEKISKLKEKNIYLKKDGSRSKG